MGKMLMERYMCLIKRVKKDIFNLLILLFVSCISIDCGISSRKVMTGTIYPNESPNTDVLNLKNIQLYLYNAGIEDAYKSIGDSILTDALFYDVFIFPFSEYERHGYSFLFYYYRNLHDRYSTVKIPFNPQKELEEFVDRINRIADESLKYINDNKSIIKDIDQTRLEDNVSQVLITKGHRHRERHLFVNIWTFENNPDTQIIKMFTLGGSIDITVPVNTKNYSHKLALSKKSSSKKKTSIYLQGKNDNRYFKIAEIELDDEGNPYLIYNNQKTALNRQNSQVLIKSLIQENTTFDRN